jgi:zinc-ribbon domain
VQRSEGYLIAGIVLIVLAAGAGSQSQQQVQVPQEYICGNPPHTCVTYVTETQTNSGATSGAFLFLIIGIVCLYEWGKWRKIERSLPQPAPQQVSSPPPLAPPPGAVGIPPAVTSAPPSFCSSCGAAVSPNQAYCTRCGKVLGV